MAFLGQDFKRDELPQGGNFEALPEGWYSVNVTQADLKQTKAGTGSYIALRCHVTGPTHQGRVVFCNININNPNPKAEEIGRQQLRQIMDAIGIPVLKDTDQLLNGQMQIKLVTKKEEGSDDLKNDVKGFKAISGGALPMPKTAAAPSSAPAKSAAPPWAK